MLLIEDEPGIVDFVRRGLEAEGFAVEAALDGIEGERLALKGGFDAIVLDLMLPGRGGFEILAVGAPGDAERAGDRADGARARSRIAWRGSTRAPSTTWSSRSRWPSSSPGVRAQLRVIAQASASTLRAEDIEVDLLTRKVRRGGRQVALSTTEFELLVYLLRHHGQVVSREQILSSVWGYEHDPATNVVDVYVGYLRRKLGDRRGPGADLHGARRRLPPRQLRLSACPRGARGACVPAGLRWRLAGWVARGDAAVHRGSPSSPSTAAPGPSCATRSTSELAATRASSPHNLALAHAGTPRASVGRPPPATCATSPSAPARRCCSSHVPGAGAEHATGPSCSTARPPTMARRLAQQARENALLANVC